MGEESSDKQGEVMEMRHRVRSVHPLHSVGIQQSLQNRKTFQKEIVRMSDFFSNEQGTAGIEYALLLSLIGMAVIGSLQAVGTNVFDVLSTLDHVFSSTQLKDDLLSHP